MKVGCADVSKKKMVLDGVEGLADVDGDSGRTHGWLLRIEADCNTVGKREKGG